jgi:hypothetical protein
VRYRVAVGWGGLPVGALLGASDLAGCNMTMLVARGVLVPVPDQPKGKRKPVGPATDTANEPEEL